MERNQYYLDSLKLMLFNERVSRERKIIVMENKCYVMYGWKLMWCNGWHMCSDAIYMLLEFNVNAHHEASTAKGVCKIFLEVVLVEKLANKFDSHLNIFVKRSNEFMSAKKVMDLESRC